MADVSPAVLSNILYRVVIANTTKPKTIEIETENTNILGSTTLL